jgi:hypothetical protein
VVTVVEEPTLTLLTIRDIGMDRRLVRAFMVGRNETTAQVPALKVFPASQTASVDTEHFPATSKLQRHAERSCLSLTKIF